MKKAQNIEQINRINKENRKTYCLSFHKEIDADVIEQLESQDSMNGYIKELIRKDIKRG